MMDFSLDTLIYVLPAVLIALTTHEFAHGYVSVRLGDPTPKLDGRLSLNPLAHLDLVGTLCLLIVGFGWAKPVQVNPYYYKQPKKGMAMVALAGPAMNFSVAFLTLLLFGFLYRFIPEFAWNYWYVQYSLMLLQYVALISIGLGVFNLIPLPPLDGSKVLGAFLPDSFLASMQKYAMYSQLLLLALLYFDFLNKPLFLLRKGVLELMLNGVWWIVGLF